MTTSEDRAQPGYDALADVYAQRFPTAYTSPLERHAVAMFADELPGPGARIVDVGCGTGHVAADLRGRGFDVRGVDPSEQMLTHARRAYPGISFDVGDAWLRDVDLADVTGLIARFSLIHLPPDDVRAVLCSWHRRLPSGATVLLALQSSDDPGVHEFDHAVARAWRWHPDALAEDATTAGFTEAWRLISRPDNDNRFPHIHLLLRR
ncbi:class I SAM-dependent methyltransferase [Gordonia sp. VNQ95]|uniref:class I SAM-dependent DNA methyltransferase n=1 Tax=Gordonia sp. VNQ95 TaxID=3156619 RepID=UPI0032B434AC